jgi:hypothetical protein
MVSLDIVVAFLSHSCWYHKHLQTFFSRKQTFFLKYIQNGMEIHQNRLHAVKN